MKRIFLKHFRGEIARKYAKTIGKSLSKTQGPKKERENKSSLPKIYRKNRPLEEENFAKIRQRTRTRP